jgi:phospholipid/cholesterol/gamma-HCH transport system ATP-binding protein
MANGQSDAVIKVRDLVVDFQARRVLNGVNVDLLRGEILGFVGASGAGKSTLARTIIGLLPKRSGRVEVLGFDIDTTNNAQKRAIDKRWGILFQQGALFSSLTVARTSSFRSVNICGCPKS